MQIRVCVAGATGWVGGTLIDKIVASDEFLLSGAIARKAAGQDIGSALGREAAGVTIAASLPEALSKPTDVLVDYTTPDTAKQRTLEAIQHGVRVVIGTSGLTAADYAEI